MAFDPDKFLAEPASQVAPDEEGFDPNKFGSGSLGWTDVPRKAVENIGPSALQFGKDIVQPFLHPVETAESLKNLGHGLLQKTNILHGDEYKKYPEAVGQFFADRYGGVENLKKTLAEDPVGFASDLSLVLTGGAALPAKIPGAVGQVGRATQTVGRAVDPLTAVGKTAKGIGHVGAELIGGLGTHTGGDSLRIAAQAGREGGLAAQAFRENMRELAPMEDTVDAARKAVQHMRAERSVAYEQGMRGVNDPTILSFNDLDAALNRADAIKTYKGQSLSPSTETIRGEMRQAVNDWKNLQASEFWTAEGFDALKQRLGDIRDKTQYGTPERVVANEIYNAARNTIIKQAPEYARVMKGYEEASKQIKEIERTLSLNPNATVDTALRKLQSVLRDNVNTSYGRRKELAEYLVNAGAPRLMERLAGQANKSWVPRGLGKLGMQMAVELGAILAGLGTGGIGHAAMYGAAALPFMSPRLMGEAAYYGGRGAGALQKYGPDPRAAYQVGRTARIAGDEE